MDLLLAEVGQRDKAPRFLCTVIFFVWSLFEVFPTKEKLNSSVKWNIRQLDGADETNRCSLKADTTHTYDSLCQRKPSLQLLFLIVREAHTPSSGSPTHLCISAHLTLLKESWTHQLTAPSRDPAASWQGKSHSHDSHTIKTVYLSSQEIISKV